MDVSSMENDGKQVTTTESSNVNTEKTNELSELDKKIDDSTSNTATEFENIQFNEIFPLNKNEPTTSVDQSETTVTEDDNKLEKKNVDNKAPTADNDDDDNKMDYDFTSELLGNCDVGDMLTKTSEINSLADETTPNLEFPNLESNTNANDEKSVGQNIEEIKETTENNETTEHSTPEVDQSIESTENMEKIHNDNDDNNTVNESDEPVNMEEDKIDECSEELQETDDLESREKQPENDDIEKRDDDNNEEIKDDIEKSNDIEKIETDISDVSITSLKESEEEKSDANIGENDYETTERIEREKDDFTDESVTRTEEIVENKSPPTEENEETKEDMEDDVKMDTSDEMTEKVAETVDKNDELKEDVEETEKMDITDDTTEDKNDEVKEDLKETENVETKDDNMDDKTDEVKEDIKEAEAEQEESKDVNMEDKTDEVKEGNKKPEEEESKVDNMEDKTDEVKEDKKTEEDDNIEDKKETADATDKVEEDVENKEHREDKNEQEERTNENDDDKSETNIDEVSQQENEDDKVDKNDEKIDEQKAEDKSIEDTDKSMDVDYGESKNVSEIDENSRDDDDTDKDKDEQTNNIEYVDLGKEIIDDNKDDSQMNSLDNTTNAQPEENPLLVDKDDSIIEPEIEQEAEQEQENENEPEESEQDQEQDKENTNKDDAADDDTVASDEVITGLENADEALCMIPEQEPVQAEKDEAFLTRCALTPPPPKEFTVKTSNSDSLETCRQCKLKRKASFHVTRRNQENGNVDEYVCSQTCLEVFKKENKDNYFLEYNQIRIRNFTKTPEMASMQEERACTFCKNKTDDEENNLTWELMDFCNEFCLWKYQKQVGSQCATCSVEVPPNSLGKYCVRFGDDIRQFCSSHCLEDYKKGLKVCSYCQQDMSKNIEGFLAPVGDKGQFKDFCSQKCMEKYDIMTNNRPPKVDKDTRCSVCDNDNDITIEFETKDGKNYFCSDRCFVAFSFVNNIIASRCSMCRRYYPNEILRKRTVFYDNVQYNFCSNSCHNIYIIAHRKIVPCAWCKVKKYNFDMIRRYFKGGTVINMCSIHCLNLFQVSINAVNSKKTLCNFCNKRHQPMYHLTMSDASIRNFCSYNCVMSFQNKFKKSPITLNNGNEETSYPVPAGEPKKSRKFALNDNTGKSVSPPLPVISSVQSLANKSNNQGGSVNGRNKVTTSTISTTQTITTTTTTTNNHQPHILNAGVTGEVGFRIKHHIIIKPAPIPEQRNVATMCKVRTQTKTTQYKPLIYDKAVQTDKEVQKAIVPVPVPLIVPTPNPLYCIPVPFPVAFPVPIPIPIFIPTTRNSAKGIMKEIKKIQVKIPTDPYEAELLMMAEMVAGDKKEENTDSESDVEDNTAAGGGGTSGGGGDEGSFSPEPVDASNTFGDDMLQMALKMATELEEPAVDLEGALTANTITASQTGEVQNEESVDDPQPLLNIPDRRGRKRGSRGGKQSSSSGNNKRRRISQQSEACVAVLPPQPVAPPEPAEKPDAHLCLKYTFGVNAWKQWVTTKNQAEMEKSSKFVKPFKTEILQLTADELNYSLCLFVKEVRKPNGAEYAPDTIYYLCLGIQQYLFENGRIDNIFCDPYYEQFTDSLDEVARKFSVLYNDSHYIVTRVEEEHLWESKQLGAHSPHVLLSTLMFFNTKHFNLTTVEEHMQLSFSHIMKHWKRNPNQSGVARTPGSRNVLLRFYPPQSAMQNNARKKKVYEQQENEENPLRCPVKLYEFYLSKCPESVKTRNDVFYLQPERSCVPDSPVWYSTTALPREALEKMLHRVKMVKEINVALLTS